MSLDSWVNHIDNEHMYCDELGLMGLSKMYHRHSVALTKTKLWSTIDTDALFNLLELLQQCSVRFVYLGHLRFGSLVWKPRISTPVASRPGVPSFEIIEDILYMRLNLPNLLPNLRPTLTPNPVVEL